MRLAKTGWLYKSGCWFEEDDRGLNPTYSGLNHTFCLCDTQLYEVFDLPKTAHKINLVAYSTPGKLRLEVDLSDLPHVKLVDDSCYLLTIAIEKAAREIKAKGYNKIYVELEYEDKPDRRGW